MDVMAWVDAYERAWRAQDTGAALDALFTPDVRYLRSAYDEGLTGIDAVREFWSDPTPFTMTAELVLQDGDAAVVRAEVHYDDERHQEFRDLWILRFADDGRVRHFEEWAHWPGLHWTPNDTADH